MFVYDMEGEQTVRFNTSSCCMMLTYHVCSNSFASIFCKVYSEICPSKYSHRILYFASDFITSARDVSNSVFTKLMSIVSNRFCQLNLSYRN